MNRFKYLNGDNILREGETGGVTGTPVETKDDKIVAPEKDNKEDTLDVDTPIWETEPEEEKVVTTQTTVDDKNKPSPEELFDNHIKTLKFMGDIDTDKLSEELREGNSDTLQGIIATVGQNAYKNAIIDSKKMFDSQIASAVESAVEQAVSRVSGNDAVKTMHEALPFTKKAAINPMASAMLNKFTKGGQPLEKAIASVKKIFKEIASVSSKDLDLRIVPNNATKNNFNQSETQHDEVSDDELNWDEVFGVVEDGN